MSVGPQECCEFELDLTNLTPSELCELVPRPLLVTGILVQWMREKFFSPNRIESQILIDNGVFWDLDIALTKISIDSVYKYNPAMTEFRPGIFIKRNPWKVLNWGIDNRLMGQVNREDPACLCPRVEIYNVGFQGSHTLFCVAGESAEVEILTAEVYRELIQFGPVIREAFNFLRFVVTDIGDPSILEEATENFVVPINVSYGAQDIWKICPDEVSQPE